MTNADTDGPAPGLDELAERAVAGLVAAGRTVAVAESLTGGGVAALLTGVPGASGAFRGGIVAYATDLKADLLGVDRDLLRRRGAVDPEVALEMARGVRDRLGADLGLATTGVAGPAAQDGQPPGTVHVCVAWRDGSSVRSAHLAGPRRAVRESAAGLALTALLDRIAAEKADIVRNNRPGSHVGTGDGNDEEDAVGGVLG